VLHQKVLRGQNCRWGCEEEGVWCGWLTARGWPGKFCMCTGAVWECPVQPRWARKPMAAGVHMCVKGCGSSMGVGGGKVWAGACGGGCGACGWLLVPHSSLGGPRYKCKPCLYVGKWQSMVWPRGAGRLAPREWQMRSVQPVPLEINERNAGQATMEPREYAGVEGQLEWSYKTSVKPERQSHDDGMVRRAKRSATAARYRQQPGVEWENASNAWLAIRVRQRRGSSLNDSRRGAWWGKVNQSGT